MTQEPPTPDFIQSTSSPAEAVVDAGWWDTNRNRVAGWLRLVSHSMVITSGLGIGTEGSLLRIIAGALGFGGAGFIGLFGKKQTSDSGADAAKEPSFVDRIRPKHTAQIYHAVLTCAALCLTASGIAKSRWTEILSGGWNSVWCLYSAAVPERRRKYSDTPDFDPNRPFHSKVLGLVTREGMRAQYEDYLANPKKLGADMQQFTALAVLLDGFWNNDMARIVSGFCLGGSNLSQRTMRNENYYTHTNPNNAVIGR